MHLKSSKISTKGAQNSSTLRYNFFLGSNCWLRIHHQIFKIQDGESNMADENLQKVSKLDENRYIEVIGITDYESIIRFQKFKMTDPIWRTKIHKGTHYNLAPRTVRGKGTHYNLAPRKRQKFYHVHVVSGLR